MEHWFDRATKFFASGAVSRREALKTGTLASAAFLFSRTFWARQLFGETQRGQRVADATPCTQRNLRGEYITTVSASTSHKGRLLTSHSVRKTVGRRAGPGTFRQRVELGGTLLHEITFRYVPGFKRTDRGKKARTAVPLGWARIRYGPAMQGPRDVLLKVTGNKVEGFSDGHPISSDRRTEALVKVDPELQASLRALAASAQSNLDNCRTVAQPHASLSRSEFLTLGLASSMTAVAGREKQVALATNGSSGMPATMQSDACNNCYNTCNNTNYVCVAAAAAIFATDPLAGAIAWAACAGTFYTCENGCFSVGGPCCSVQCGSDICCDTGQFCCQSQGIAPACCDNGSVCVTGLFDGFYEYAYCCPGGSDPAGCQEGDSYGDIALYCRQPNQTCCGVYWPCGAGQFCANVAYGICCPNGQTFCADTCCNGTCLTYNAGTSIESQVCCPGNNACGNNCCQPGQTCKTSPSGNKVCCIGPLCGEQCCDGGICSNGTCGFGQPCGNTFCGLTTHCCGGTCCEVCCNNQCCPSSDYTCSGGQCCPKQQSCGSTCCPPGQFCNSGKCVTGCPQGTDLSVAPDGSVTCCQMYQCDNPSNDNVCTAAACPKGVCCSPYQVCCPGEAAGSYICSNPPCPIIAQ